MKKLLFITCILINYSLFSQVESIYLGINIDIHEQMQNDDTDTINLNIDSDPDLDLRIVSWTGHTIGTEIMVSIELLNNDIPGLKIMTDYYDYLSGCSEWAEYNSNFGIILNSDQNTLPFAPKVNFPIKLTNGTGIQYGFLSVESTSQGFLKIKNYTFHNDGTEISCMGNLGIDELDIDHTNNGSFEYFNLLGQKITDPSGLCIKRYESGRAEQVFITK